MLKIGENSLDSKTTLNFLAMLKYSGNSSNSLGMLIFQ